MMSTSAAYGRHGRRMTYEKAFRVPKELLSVSFSRGEEDQVEDTVDQYVEENMADHRIRGDRSGQNEWRHEGRTFSTIQSVAYEAGRTLVPENRRLMRKHRNRRKRYSRVEHPRINSIDERDGNIRFQDHACRGGSRPAVMRAVRPIMKPSWKTFNTVKKKWSKIDGATNFLKRGSAAKVSRDYVAGRVYGEEGLIWDDGPDQEEVIHGVDRNFGHYLQN